MKKLIDMKDPVLTKAIDDLMIVFSGGDNLTFIKFIQLIHDSEIHAHNGHKASLRFIDALKKLGSVINIIRKGE
jgi:hypothetical protein